MLTHLAEHWPTIAAITASAPLAARWIIKGDIIGDIQRYFWCLRVGHRWLYKTSKGGYCYVCRRWVSWW